MYETKYDYEFEHKLDRGPVRKLIAYLSKAEGFGEDSDTVYACNDLRDTLREQVSQAQPAEPDKIGSVVRAPLHRDDEGLVEWVYDGSYGWHHKNVERTWYDLDVYEVVRVGTDVSDQQHLRRRISGLVGVILEARNRLDSIPGRDEAVTEALKSDYALQISFMEEMLSEIDPDYRWRGPDKRRRKVAEAHALGTYEDTSASEEGVDSNDD